MTTPTFKLREDAIVHLLELELKQHGEDVVVEAISEFFLRHGRTPMLRRVTSKSRVLSRKRADDKRSDKLKSQRALAKTEKSSRAPQEQAAS